MSKLELVVQIATLASMAVGAFGLFLGIVVYRRQMNAQVFLEYTKRYEDVMDSFPESARAARLDISSDPPPESPELTTAVLRYVNLCSEEFYLCKRRYLSKEIWRIWESELKRSLRSPLIRREWAKLGKEFSSYPEFVEYVTQAQSV